MNYVFLNRAAVILSVALSLCPLLFCLPLLFYRIPVPEASKTNQHHRSMASRTKPCDNMQDDPCEQGEAMR